MYIDIGARINVCGEIETVRQFTYLGDRVSVGGGCEAVVPTLERIECQVMLCDLNFFRVLGDCTSSPLKKFCSQEGSNI